MENVTDALYMAFAVLAFVIALSVSIIAFGQASEASQSIIYARDRELTYAYIKQKDAIRIVKREDIIPTLYRAYKENYIVRFEGTTKSGEELTDKLYKVKDLTLLETQPSNPYKDTSTIDLEGQSIGNQADANKFITALLQGKNGDKGFNKLLEDTTRFSYFGEYLQNKSFYDILGGENINPNTFEEKLGVFYQEDRTDNKPGGTSSSSVGLDDVNKTKKRIITYVAK